MMTMERTEPGLGLGLNRSNAEGDLVLMGSLRKQKSIPRFLNLVRQKSLRYTPTLHKIDLRNEMPSPTTRTKVPETLAGEGMMKREANLREKGTSGEESNGKEDGAINRQQEDISRPQDTWSQQEANPQDTWKLQQEPATITSRALSPTANARFDMLRETKGNIIKHTPYSLHAFRNSPLTDEGECSPQNITPSHSMEHWTEKDEIGYTFDSSPRSSPRVQKSDSNLRTSAFHKRETHLNMPTITSQRKVSTSANDLHLPRPATATHLRVIDSPQASPHTHTPLKLGSARSYDFEQRHVKPLYTDPFATWNSADDDFRQSARSGVSATSSAATTCSTEHSSIYTKLSCMSDATAFSDELADRGDGSAGLEEDDGLTVDDCIDLYSAGFDDDLKMEDGDTLRGWDESRTLIPGESCENQASFPNQSFQPRPGFRSSRSSQEKQRALETRISDGKSSFSKARLEHALSIDSVLTPPSPSSAPPDSPSISSGALLPSLYHPPPSIAEPTTAHDQYGFRKHSRHVSLAQHDSWYAAYAMTQARRTRKWYGHMRDLGYSTIRPLQFPDRSAKMQRYIRKGVPPEWRGEVWFFYAGGPACLAAQPGRYAELLRLTSTPALGEHDREAIERDLHRTFPDNIHFKPESPARSNSNGKLEGKSESPLIGGLRRVLSAFAIHHPRIGYCQSLNFLAGMLLLFLPEDKAFWMLHIITTTILPGAHGLSLEGTSVDMWVLMLALQDALPALATRLSLDGGHGSSASAGDPSIAICTTPWFMALFVGNLPPESTLRVWDVLFYEGSRTLFRVAVAIFRLAEPAVRASIDRSDVFQAVQALPRCAIDAAALLELACRRGGVTQAWVDRQRRERRAFYERERATEMKRRESRDGSLARLEMGTSKIVGWTEPVDEGDEDEAVRMAFGGRGRSNSWWRMKHKI